MKINYRYFIGSVVLVFSLLQPAIRAQQRKTPQQVFSGYLRPESSEKILIMEEKSTLTRDQILQLLGNGSEAVLPSYVTLQLINEETGQTGTVHATYAVRVGAAEVEDAVVKFHERDGIVKSVSLTDFNIPNMNTIPLIGASEALTLATRKVTKCVPTEEQKNQLQAPKLVIVHKDSSSVLAWTTEVYGESILDVYTVYIDAGNGEIAGKVSHKRSCTGPAVVPTLYDGNQSIYYDFPYGNSTVYELADNNCHPVSCGGTSGIAITITQWSPNPPQNYTIPVGGTWPTTLEYKTAYSIQWALGKSYDYYKCIHNRNSYDNSGHSLTGLLNIYTTVADNTYYAGSGTFNYNFQYSSNTYRGPMASLDITAHEFTHAVIKSTSNLTYTFESGALNEAWADIMAVSAEYFVKGSSGNFLIGEDVALSGLIRSLSNPNGSHPAQPDTYKGTYWYSATGCTATSDYDFCGVHTNSGVANFWYYLLVNGGTGTNDIGSAYNVAGIGISYASAIAYKAMTSYFTPTTNYADARMLTILAAEELYGICSNQAIQTARAWYAVGVGHNVDNILNVCKNFNSGETESFKAFQTIRSGGANCGGVPVSINSGATVSFTAGSQIDLGPDFTANTGSSFTATIATLCVAGQGVSTFREADAIVDGAGYTYVNQEAGMHISEAPFAIYPNPSSGAFTMEASTDGVISVLNSLGKEIFSAPIAQKQVMDLDLSMHSKGIYFVKFKNGSEVKSRKLVIE